MEDMARLALVEQSVRDVDKFSNILYELLRHITHILENSHDCELRTIKSSLLMDFLKVDAFSEYLKYVGFEWEKDNFVYRNSLALSNLRMAKVAIERKISICCGSIDKSQVPKPQLVDRPAEETKLVPVNILTTNNSFLLRIQSLFNNMIQYEDPGLLEEARQQIPIVALQIMALDRMREQQRKIKTGEIKTQDLPFDIAFLMELIIWFKDKFFQWVDKPQCECGGETRAISNTTQKIRGEYCSVELYECIKCKKGVKFPRFNNPRTLLEWRRGRCGEFANCFTLLCRAMGYDVRYIYDVTDHVWCEVFDYDSNTWLHVDPCEAKINAPLMYSHGWGKQLSYVIALSRDDLQDVTWRYTTEHKMVLKRRKLCSEAELLECIMALRQHRQRQISEPRRQYLTKRTVIELVQLMIERRPEEYESQGRVSGSVEWRRRRGECGDRQPHTFLLRHRGTHEITYSCARDEYKLNIKENTNERAHVFGGWSTCAFQLDNVFRKVENDWKQAYLTRTEGSETGSISWQFQAVPGFECSNLFLLVSNMLYENGKIMWTVTFDDEPPVVVHVDRQTQVSYDRKFKSVTVRAMLSGGRGSEAWQHAQIFRQPLGDSSAGFQIRTEVYPQPSDQ